MRLLTLFLVIAVGLCAGKSLDGPRRAFVTFKGADVQGKVLLEQASLTSPVKIRGVVYGLEPGQHSIDIHQGTVQGDRCDSIGLQFNPEGENERSIGYLGNVKTFSGVPTRTDINIISSLISLYEDHASSVLRRSLVIHALPNNYARNKMYTSSDEGVLACGMIEVSEVDYEEIFRPLERDSVKSNRFDAIEKSILDGEKPWENVRHPFYGRPESVESKKSAERSELSHDSLSLKSAVPTPKVWKAGRTYEYDYKGFIATGMFGLSPKTSGGSIEGRLVVEALDESTINVALLSIKTKMFNEDVLPELVEANPGTESRIVDQHHLEKPVQIKIVNGKIESVAISKDEPLWTVNFKRALAAQLQLQLDGTSGVFGEPALAGYYADNTVYHAMEGCTSGECETWYHISQLSKEQLNAEPELLTMPELCDNAPVFEIIKNRDFDKCRVLPLYQYVSLQGLKCDAVNGAGCENKISHIDLVRIVGCRSAEGHFIVQRVKAMDKLVFKPFSYETEATEGKTIQHLTLRAIHSADALSLAKRIHTDVHLYQSLSYSFDEDYKTHGPLMGKPSLRHANSPMTMEVDKEVAKSEAERLLNEIVADLESESFAFDPSSKYIPAKIDMLRRALSSFDYPELMAFVDKALTAEQWSTKNQVVLDAVILTGTNPALMIVRDLILNRRITGELAVQAVAVLVGTVETPTKELLTSFIDMLKSEVVSSHRQLKITSALFISKLVYQACINSTMSLNMFPKLVMGEFCNAGDNAVVNHLVPWLTEQLHSATDAGERIAMLTALGNLGHEMILPSVLPFITSCEPSTAAEFEWIERNHKDSGLSLKELRQKWLQYKKEEQLKKNNRNVEADNEHKSEWNVYNMEEDKAACNLVRSKAIFALANLAAEKKEVVGTILMPIYFNKAEETEVRLAALSLLFVSNPPQAFWTRVAVSTWFEPNEQVAHYIYTTVASMVANKDPLRREAAVRAESVLPLMKPMLWTSHSAINYVKAGYEEKARIGYITETVAFPGFESFIPSHHYNSMYVTLGPWFTKLIEYSVSGKQVEKFIDRLMGKPGMRSMAKSERDASKIISPELKKIQEELKIEARATGQPELYIYLNFLDNYQRFFTLNPSSILDTVEKTILKKGFASPNGEARINYHKYLPVLDSFMRIPSSMGLSYSVIGHHAIFFSLKSDVRGGLDMTNFAAKLEGELRPAVVAKMSHRLMAETPFTRAYPFTGVEFQTAAALPGRFAVTGDLKTSKLATSFELMGDKLRLVKYSVTPFTSIRKIDDFTPALLLKDTKIISLLEEPKEVKNTFGRSLGLNMIYVERGDVKAMKTPLTYSKDWFGTLAFYALPFTLRHREMNIFLDVANSESKALKTYISLAAKTPETLKSNVDVSDDLFTKSLFNTRFAETIKKDEQYVKEKNEEWTAHKLNRVFKTLSNPTGYSLDIAAELVTKSDVKIHRIGAAIAYGIDNSGKTHRATIMMEKQSESENNFILCTEYESKRSDKSIKRDMFNQAECTDVFRINFGKSCTDDRKITVTTKMSRADEEFPSTIRTKWEEERCQKHELTGKGISKECMTTRRMGSMLNKAVVTIDYNEMPAIVRNATAKFNNIFRHFMAPHMSDNQVEVRNTENQIRIESVYYPVIGSMDLKVFKPKSNTFFHAIDVHPVAEVMLPTRFAAAREFLAAPGVCLIDRETITTFDGLSYNASISSCDQVITKDCSGRYNFAVLARRESAKKIFTVLLDKENIEIDAAEKRVFVNGKEVRVEETIVVKSAEDKIVAFIRRTPDNWIEVESPSHMIRVTVGDKEIVIAGSPIHRGRLCGLCGSATGNKVTDLTGPRKCSLPRDLMSAAYELQRPAGCQSAKSAEREEELRRVQNKCVEEKKRSVYGVSDAKPLLPRFQQTIYSSQVIRSASQYVQYCNKMIVRDDKSCFSTISLPKCVDGAKPTAVVEQKVAFHCLANNVLAGKLSEEMHIRPLDELNGKEISLIQTVSVPRACVMAQ